MDDRALFFERRAYINLRLFYEGRAEGGSDHVV